MIGRDEWLAMLDADPELSRAADSDDDMLAGTWKGETIFWFTDGEVRCKNPDQPVICKIVEIAERLKATVQGDDGEIYRENGTAFQPESGPSRAPTTSLLSRIRAWFKPDRR